LRYVDGLQGLGGTSTLNLMLLRQVSDGGGPTSEGLTERGVQTLRYAYLPHAGTANEAQIWRAATAFNQPLIPAWRSGAQIRVQLPFLAASAQQTFALDPAARALPSSYSLMSADHGMIADLYRRNDQVEALILNLDLRQPVTITSGATQTQIPPAALTVLPWDSEVAP